MNYRASVRLKLVNILVRGLPLIVASILLRLIDILNWNLATYGFSLVAIALIQSSLYFVLLDKSSKIGISLKDKYSFISIMAITWAIPIVSMAIFYIFHSGGFNFSEHWLALPMIATTLIFSFIVLNLFRTFLEKRFGLLISKLEQFKELIRRYDSQLRTAIDQIKNLKSKVSKLQERLSILTQFYQNLGKRWNLKETFSQVATMLMKLFSYQTLVIFQYDPVKMILEPVYYKSQYPYKVRNMKIKLGETVVGESVKTAKPILCRERSDSVILSREKKLFYPLFTEDKVAMVAPLSFNNSIIGAIYLGHNLRKAYDKEDLELLELISYELSLVFSFYQEYTRSRDLAITDGLTGLYTHRYFQERLKDEVARAKRYGGTLSLLMIDTDHFKRFNDTYGHPEGDKLLQRIAQFLKGTLRESDIVCRYGGDEFAVILPNTNKEDAVKIAERIREGYKVVNLPQHEVKVTFSIGVANYPIDASDKESLINVADQNLYKAKKGGRNRVVAD